MYPSQITDRRLALAEAGVLFALALGVRLIHLDHTPVTDEINHVLAARSLLADGTLRLDAFSAPYTRGWFFTYLTAGMFALFGESLTVARVLPVLFGAGLVVTLFVAVRVAGGRTAAWTAGLLLALAPISIYVSQYTRFYSLHALLVLLAAIAVYRLTVAPWPSGFRAAALAAGAVSATVLAYHLQPSTLIAVLALFLWMAVRVGPRIVSRVRRHPRRFPIAIVGAVATAVLVGLVLENGLLGYVSARLEGAALWAEGARNDYQYYHSIFVNQYATLWTLFPVAVILASRRNRTAAAFATLFFAVAFTVHSIAAFKSERYLVYALPMFFAVWGMALGVAFPWLLKKAEHVFRAAVPAPLRSPRTTRTVGLAALSFSIVFAAHGNRASTYLRHMLTRTDAEWVLPARYRGEPDWQAAARILAPLAREADVVLASSDIEPLYFLERLDLHLGRSGGESFAEPEFHPGRKTRRPRVVAPESVELLMACYSTGLIVAEDKRWGIPAGVPDSLATFIERRLTPVPLPKALRMSAFRWDLGPPESSPECTAVARSIPTARPARGGR